MTLQEKLRDIKRTSTLNKLNEYPVVEIAKDLDELWEKVIEPNLPVKSAVEQWHRVLKDYVEQENVAFSIRRFGSRTKKENSLVLRRGFLNKVFVNGHESFSTFYVDNAFPAYFYSMAKDGYAPSDWKEFKELVDNFEFPCGFIQTSAEQELAAYHRGTNPEISYKGYKIAHIFSAGEKYSNTVGYAKIGDFCKEVFPRGDRDEWHRHVLPTGQHYRPILLDDVAKAKKIRSFAVAHFLRTVHPINYFLVPNKTNTRDECSGIIKTNIYWHDYDNGCQEQNEIGEYSKLVEYVAAKIKDIYKDVLGNSGKSIYAEFLDLIYPTGNCIDPKEVNVTIDAKYAIGLWQKKIGSVPVHKTTGSKAGTASKTSSKVRKIRKHPPVSIELIPNDPDAFEKELLNKKKAKITLTYADGHTLVDNWDARRYKSDLMKRINDKLWNEPDRDQIVKAVFEVL